MLEELLDQMNITFYDYDGGALEPGDVSVYMKLGVFIQYLTEVPTISFIDENNSNVLMLDMQTLR